jgi:hypothetical protein
MSGINDSNANYGDDLTATADVLNKSGTQGAVSVGTSAVAARVGASNLANRKVLTVYNNSSGIVYWGYTNAVIVATGTPILKNQMSTWTVGQDVTVYLIAGSAGNDCRVTEAS